MPPLLRAYLRLYWDCLRATPRGFRKSPWVVLLPMLYGVIAALASIIAAPLGLVGGFLIGFVDAALAASLLYMLEALVSATAVKPREVVTSVRRYLWPVMNVLFIFWIAQLIVGPALGSLKNGAVITLALMAVLFILLNATPETIYQRRTYGGIATLVESGRFIQEHWIEWFIPNLLFGAALWFGLPRLLVYAPLGLGTWGVTLFLGLLEGALLLPIMVFRGHLYRELTSGGLRRRRIAGGGWR